MSELVMKLTRLDGKIVYLVKAMVVAWSPNVEGTGTKITLLDDFQIVRETPERILELIDGR